MMHGGTSDVQRLYVSELKRRQWVNGLSRRKGDGICSLEVIIAPLYRVTLPFSLGF